MDLRCSGTATTTWGSGSLQNRYPGVSVGYNSSPDSRDNIICFRLGVSSVRFYLGSYPGESGRDNLGE